MNETITGSLPQEMTALVLEEHGSLEQINPATEPVPDIRRDEALL